MTRPGGGGGVGHRDGAKPIHAVVFLARRGRSAAESFSGLHRWALKDRPARIEALYARAPLSAAGVECAIIPNPPGSRPCLIELHGEQRELISLLDYRR